LALCPERLLVVPPWGQHTADHQGMWVVALLAQRDMLQQQLVQGAAGGRMQQPRRLGGSREEVEQLLEVVQLRLQEMQRELSCGNSAVGIIGEAHM
jgi:hypothetical protein